MHLRLRNLIVLAAIAAFHPSSASAETASSPPVTSNLKLDGDRLFDALHYEEALTKYELAYKLQPLPALLYNQGRCHEALGRYPQAIRAYEEFLSKASDDLKAKVPGLVELIAKLRTRVATLQIRTNVAGAKVTFRDHVLGTTPLRPIELAEGQGVLEAFADGYQTSRQPIFLRGGTVNTVDLSLFAIAHKHEAKSPSIASRWWFWTAIAGVALGGVAITIAATTERSADRGNYGQGQVSAPLEVAR